METFVRANKFTGFFTALKFLKGFLTVLMLIALTIWGVLAVYFGDSQTSIVQTFIAVIYGLSFLSGILYLLWSRWKRPWLIGHLLFFLAILIWWLNIAASNDRLWQTDVSRLAYATINGNLVTVNNIRNFSYKTEFDYSPNWYSKTFDLTKLEGVDLFSIYWSTPAIAHTIVSFDFGDQGHLAVSIETRMEQSEAYSTIKGFFRQFELIYIVADERDVIGLRTNYRKNEFAHLYKLKVQNTKATAKAFFLEYIRQINELHDHPQFYNTLLDNCTTAIWLRTLAFSDHLPFSWKILVSGYLPEYLYESNRLDQTLPFEQLKQQAYINKRAEEAGISDDFSARIREKN
jgi:hypothetical protein